MMPTRTGRSCRISGIYHSACHGAERTVLEGQSFPTCGYCNLNTQWTCVRPNHLSFDNNRVENNTFETTAEQPRKSASG